MAALSLRPPLGPSGSGGGRGSPARSGTASPRAASPRAASPRSLRATGMSPTVALLSPRAGSGRALDGTRSPRVGSSRAPSASPPLTRSASQAAARSASLPSAGAITSAGLRSSMIGGFDPDDIRFSSAAPTLPWLVRPVAGGSGGGGDGGGGTPSGGGASARARLAAPAAEVGREEVRYFGNAQQRTPAGSPRGGGIAYRGSSSWSEGLSLSPRAGRGLAESRGLISNAQLPAAGVFGPRVAASGPMAGIWLAGGIKATVPSARGGAQTVGLNQLGKPV